MQQNIGPGFLNRSHASGLGSNLKSLTWLAKKLHKSSRTAVCLLSASFTVRISRLGKECSGLCQMAYNCTAYHHDRCFKICELGKKNGLVSASQPGADTMTVLIQPGSSLLPYHIIIFSRGI